MPGYLSRLVARSFLLTDVVRPDIASRFAPTGDASQPIDPEAISVTENNQGISNIAEQAVNDTLRESPPLNLLVSGGPETSSAIEGAPRETMVRDDDVWATARSDSESKTKRDITVGFCVKKERPPEGDSIDRSRSEPEAGVIVQESTSENRSLKKCDLLKVSASGFEKSDQRSIELRPFLDHPLKASTRSMNMDSTLRPSRLESKHISHTESMGMLVSEPPTIKVHIGRIEVRAMMSREPAFNKEPQPPRPSITLEQYLKRRDRGRS